MKLHTTVLDSPPDADAVSEAAHNIMRQMAPLLYGAGPYVQGVALGQALARWLAGHPDHLREQVLTAHVNFVRSLVPEVEREIFEGGRHPQSTGQGQPS
jgi:hypothetical protein